MKINQNTIQNLSYLCKAYDGLNKLLVSTKNRLLALNKEALPKQQDEVRVLESLKGNISRRIEKELENWPVWVQWLKNVPGIGPFIAGHLILLYYYAFIPICPKCEAPLAKKEKKEGEENKQGGYICPQCNKVAKGDGLLTHKIKERDFANISCWWHYMGRHTVNGVIPKRKVGMLANWSTAGRTLGFHLGDQFNRQDDNHPYKSFMLKKKKKHEQKHPDWSKGHIHNAAKNEAIKLFLSHFWVVARTLDNKPVTAPYAETILGHTGIIKPFY